MRLFILTDAGRDLGVDRGRWFILMNLLMFFGTFDNYPNGAIILGETGISDVRDSYDLQ
jgi:hypothetical protein